MSETWEVALHGDFEREFDALPEAVQDELLARARLLQQFGPQLGRPRADTLKGSQHSNMKELRFAAADGVWRVAFAFDPNRKAILLACGDKSGGSEKRFYRQPDREGTLDSMRISQRSAAKGKSSARKPEADTNENVRSKD